MYMMCTSDAAVGVEASDLVATTDKQMDRYIRMYGLRDRLRLEAKSV
jgi:hypothetical protein